MALHKSDSYHGYSQLPTNTNAGVVSSHRSAIIFPVSTVLAANDLLVLGRLEVGFVPANLQIDSDGVTGLTADILLVDSLETPTLTVKLATAASFVEEAVTKITLSKEAIRFKGTNIPLFVVAKVVNGGTADVGKELGVTLDYRFRQITY